MPNTEKILITKSQYNALVEIRGLQQDAHYMVLAAKKVTRGYVIEGSSEVFDHLAHDLSDEVHYDLSPQYRLKHLRTLLSRLQPDSDFY